MARVAVVRRTIAAVGLLSVLLAAVLAAAALVGRDGPVERTETASTTAPSEAPRSSQNSGSPTSAPTAVPSVPAPQGSPVFVGEPCDPAAGADVGAAVNGLTLYCVPASPGLGRWTSPSPPSAAARPEPGGSCDASDAGKVIPDMTGRLVACLPDAAGNLRWSDVS